MSSVPIRPLVDRVLAGRLDDFLREARDNGQSAAATSRRLFAEHGIEVSAETVRKWFAELESAA